MNECDFEIPCLDKKEVEKKIESIQTELSYYQDVLSFMNDNKTEEYDENEFKAYQILKEIGKDATDYQKSKAIAKILKNK